MFFGKLIETQEQRLKRLKLESAGKLTRSPPSTINSEFAWMLSTCKKLNVISIQPKDANENLPTNLERQAAKPENVMNDCSNKVDNNAKEEKRTLKTENHQSNNTLLPKAIVQKLLHFPMYEVTKTSDERWDGSSKVITLSAMANKACLKYPSVTKILSATMSEEAKSILEKWKKKMIEKLGLKGFEIYQAELFEDGKLLHTIIMSHLTQKPYDVPNKIKQSFDSLGNVLEDINQVRAVESHAIHSRLMYRGVVDCIATYRGELCIIDWKKSDKAKSTIGATYDAPLQLASYIGAVNSDPNYPFQIKKGLIAVAYTNGDPATVHEVNEDLLKMYWKLWLQRLQDYHVALNTPP
ncbi:mitochondrial genome maintenance exonuclease 1 [Copidosoma floridanum]|uniref:mitochondrial genome maintenance exonuclease 1 n=1 Tax=Copidosoma floridanum TaxID=29053 RepID=UPI0006C9E514|nr:mitochondrial genome maintenance exonuclease 1 [Copidosoma floridanum]